MKIALKEWTSDRLAALPKEKQLAMVGQIAGGLLHQKILLGRCLSVLKRSRAYEVRGCSSVIHYAKLKLGVEEREAREVLLAAERLELLPVLTKAVEENQICWSKLRLVLTRADEENEAEWLEKARSMNVQALEKVVRQASHDNGQPKLTCYEVWLPVETLTMLQRAFEKLRAQAGHYLSDAECLECLAAAKLAGGESPDERTMEMLRDQAGRDVAAQLQAEAPQVPEVPAEWENKRLRFSGLSKPITGPQRREILRRDGYRCVVPGCCNRQWLHVHHLSFRSEGGSSLRWNLATVCSTCHSHVHRGLLQVRGQPPDLIWADCRGRELGVETGSESWVEAA